jgi:hypothetical protein
MCAEEAGLDIKSFPRSRIYDPDTIDESFHTLFIPPKFKQDRSMSHRN